MLALAAAACGRPSQPSEEELHRQRDAELANSVASDLGSDPQNPFQSAQTLAEDSMGAAVGRTLDQTWIRMMIEHQEGASRFADIMLRSHTTEPVRSAAERVKQESHERIAALKQLREASLSTDTSTADPFGGVISDTFARMTYVQGTSVAQTWALKMAAYDRGAVTLAGIEATKGQDARVRNLARKLASALANEADQLEALNRTSR